MREAGGGGDPGPTERKKALTFFFFKFSSYFTEEVLLLFSKIPGVQYFPVEGVVKLLISIETFKNCDFPCLSLDPHIFFLKIKSEIM